MTEGFACRHAVIFRMAQSLDSTIPAIATWLAQQQRHGTRVVGINGAQGSGKSTLAQALVRQLEKDHSLRAVCLSLDDLYLPRADRLKLAQTTHPLLATRGVPGTHDCALGIRLLEALPQLGTGETLTIPRFLKLTDDRVPPEQWRRISGPVDLVLFEGWCVGTPPQPPAALAESINSLEANEDPDGCWRRWVNARLAGDYATLFQHLDALIFLAAPNFDCVLDWRLQQEATTASTEHGSTMNRDQIRAFIACYERLTRHALARLPQRADAVIQLDAKRKVQSVTLQRCAGGR